MRQNIGSKRHLTPRLWHGPPALNKLKAARKMRTFVDLAEKLKMPVEDLMRQCNGKAPPSKALVKGLAKELDIDEAFLNRLADEVRKDLGTK
jgi:transcriptional regulator with XRE-family HTH domain